MKVYYLFAPVEPDCVGPTSGIEKKVKSQVESLCSESAGKFSTCTLVTLPVVEHKGNALEKIVRRLPRTAGWRKWSYKGEFHDADALYIRKVNEDASFIKYLKAVKHDNPDIQIIYEIPTYPEKTGNANFANLNFILKERHAKKQLHKYIDRIVTFYGQNAIYNIPCIQLKNGYDFSKVDLPTREKTDSVKLLSVALNMNWHGYDRLIKGIKKYYADGGTEKIIYHVVGPILNEYGERNDHIILHGPLHGEELNALYKECLVGIDILGGHRKDYPVSSTLKSREYAAYGLPMVTSSPIDYMPEGYLYQHLVPYDDSPIDIKALLKWYHSVYDGRDCNIIAKEIRDYAFDRCDMRATMKPVLDYLNHEQ